MNVEQIIKALNDFVPYPEDDPIHDNVTFLDEMMDAWKQAADKVQAIPAIFALIEKYPNADFGSPSPLVHALESAGAGLYEGELHKSLLRRPTPLTLWMYNRIINAEKDVDMVSAHLVRLKLFGRHPLADAEARASAQNFIDHQSKRLRQRSD